MNNLQKELQACVRFFLDTASKKESSFGLVPDSYPTKYSGVASIAGTGFYFPALIIAVKERLLGEREARAFAKKALRTLANLPKVHGWFYHFYEIETAAQTQHSEVSTIDTALLLAGALTAGSYFGGEILKSAQNLLENIDFPYFLQVFGTMFSMSAGQDGVFHGHWDRYAEQLLLYVLGAGNPNEHNRMDPEIYYGFQRDHGSYGKHEFICSWHGSLFTYQYSHGYIDFRGLVDRDGVDWFKNSVEASKAAYEYTVDHEGEFPSFHRLSWGLTACAKEGGYSGRYGSPPSGEGITFNDGTVAPCASLGSIVFTPKESIAALDFFYEEGQLLGDYGLRDSYNEGTNYICPYYLAIDKGISMIMVENHLRGTVWDCFMSLECIQEGLRRIGLKKGN